MTKRRYTRVKELLPAIKAMVEQGRTQREIAEYYGFKDKMVVKRLLNRQFSADRPNSKWVTDISYIHTKEGVR